jgi:hypothetical protein
MTTAPISLTDTIVLDYLAALWAQSEDLTPELRDELMTTVTDYIAVRRAADEDPAEILRRLGSPEALVTAVRLGQPTRAGQPAEAQAQRSTQAWWPAAPPPAAWQPVAPRPGNMPVRARGAGAVEYTGIGLLGAGAFVVPVLGPFAGLLLITGSPYWTPAQKAAAWLLTAASGAGAFALLLVLTTLSIVHAPAALLVYLAVCAGPVLASIHLLSALRSNEAG